MLSERQAWYRNVYLVSDHWRNLRGRKLRGTPYCQICRTRSHLDVHHLDYGEDLLNVRLSQLCTLCRSCHQLQHSNRTDADKITREKALIYASDKARKRIREKKLAKLSDCRNSEKGFAQPRKKWDSLTQAQRYARFFG